MISVFLILCNIRQPWWRNQMETFPALLALCARNSPVTGEFPAQSPVTRSFDVFFGLRSNKRLCKQSWRRWFEVSSSSLWHHCNGVRTGSVSAQCCQDRPSTRCAVRRLSIRRHRKHDATKYGFQYIRSLRNFTHIHMSRSLPYCCAHINPT